MASLSSVLKTFSDIIDSFDTSSINIENNAIRETIYKNIIENLSTPSALSNLWSVDWGDNSILNDCWIESVTLPTVNDCYIEIPFIGNRKVYVKKPDITFSSYKLTITMTVDYNYDNLMFYLQSLISNNKTFPKIKVNLSALDNPYFSSDYKTKSGFTDYSDKVQNVINQGSYTYIKQNEEYLLPANYTEANTNAKNAIIEDYKNNTSGSGLGWESYLNLWSNKFQAISDFDVNNLTDSLKNVIKKFNNNYITANNYVKYLNTDTNSKLYGTTGLTNPWNIKSEVYDGNQFLNYLSSTLGLGLVPKVQYEFTNTNLIKVSTPTNLNNGSTSEVKISLEVAFEDCTISRYENIETITGEATTSMDSEKISTKENETNTSKSEFISSENLENSSTNKNEWVSHKNVDQDAIKQANESLQKEIYSESEGLNSIENQAANLAKNYIPFR